MKTENHMTEEELEHIGVSVNYKGKLYFFRSIKACAIWMDRSEEAIRAAITFFAGEKIDGDVYEPLEPERFAGIAKFTDIDDID